MRFSFLKPLMLGDRGLEQQLWQPAQQLWRSVQ